LPSFPTTTLFRSRASSARGPRRRGASRTRRGTGRGSSRRRSRRSGGTAGSRRARDSGQATRPATSRRRGSGREGQRGSREVTSFRAGGRWVRRRRGPSWERLLGGRGGAHVARGLFTPSAGERVSTTAVYAG